MVNLLIKSCLLTDSFRSEKTDATNDTGKDNPYFDDNEVMSAFSSAGSSKASVLVPAPQLGCNMMRQLQDRDPFEVYEMAKLLGTGSMGSVCMVKKRVNNVGGSARLHNLSARKRLEMYGVHPMAVKMCMLPVVGRFFEVCSGLEEYTKEMALASKEHISNSNHRLDTSYTGSSDKLGMDSPHGGLDISRQSVGSMYLTPQHIRINNYLEKQRAQGQYEPYYALKSIHLNHIHDPQFVSELKNEIRIMKNLDHAHIVRPIETYQHKSNLYMVMELCSGGDLYSRDPYTEDQSARIVSTIMNAVAFMHEHNIVHRDLKYENIMFANNSPKAEIKIIDFGLSKKYLPNQTLKDGVGTVYTMSPQVLQGDYDNKSDVWAVGVLSYMLLSSQMPFYGRKRREILEKIMKCSYDFKGRRWSTVSSQAKTFVSDLLQFEADARPSAEEAKQSLWLNMKMHSSVRTASDDDMDAVAFSIESYSNHRTLHKLALMVMAHKSTSEEIGFLRKVFKRYDTDKSGQISLDEFKQCLNKYGYSDEYMEHLFTCADLGGSNTIKYTEFLAATIESTGLVTEERVAEAFDRLDSDDSGFISFENLRELLGDDVPSDYIDQIITEVDFNNDKRITYQEFLGMWDIEFEERQLENISGINARRTVRDLEEEVLDEDSVH